MNKLFFPIAFFAAGILSAQSLTWDECVRLASSSHPDLIVAAQNLTSAKADKTSATSDRLPSVDATGSLSAHRADDQTAKSSSVGLTATQILWDGGATAGKARAASASVDTASANLTIAQAQVRYNLRVAYLDVWRQQQLTRVLESIEKLRATNLRMISLRYEGGTEHKGALLQSQAKHSAASAEIAANTRSAGVVSRHLSQAMGSATVADYTITETPVALAEPISSGNLEVLANNHPSVLKAAAAVTAAKANLKTANAQNGPTLTATVGASRSDTNDFSPSDNAATAGVNLRWPLLDFGAKSASVAKARAQLNAAQATLTNTRRSVLIQLQEAFNAYQSAWDDNAVAGENLLAASERNRIAKAQYEVGLITYDNWSIIEDSYVSAQKSSIDSAVAALKAEAAWINTQAKIYGEN